MWEGVYSVTSHPFVTGSDILEVEGCAYKNTGFPQKEACVEPKVHPLSSIKLNLTKTLSRSAQHKIKACLGFTLTTPRRRHRSSSVDFENNMSQLDCDVRDQIFPSEKRFSYESIVIAC